MGIEELRQKRAAQLQAQFNQQQQEEEISQAYEMQKDALLKKALTPEAKSRLTTLKLANPQLADQVEQLLLYVIQSKQITQIDDATLKKILEKIRGKKREPTITRK